MAVKKVFSTKNKPGWKYDDKQKKFWSYGYDIRLENGKRIRESGFASKQLAEGAVSRIRIDEKEGKYQLQTRKFPLIFDVLQKRLNRIESRKEKRRALTIFDRWLEMLPKNLRFNELEKSHLQLYLDARLDKVKPVSINREITTIASAIHSAHIDYPELENFKTPKIPRPKTPRSRRERLISHAEIIKLFQELFAERRQDENQSDYQNRITAGHAFNLALLTGARIGEITALTWTEVDFDAKILSIIGVKNRFTSTKNVRYLELTPSIEKILRERQRLDAFGPNVFSRTGNSITHYYTIMRECAQRAGVNYGQKVKGGMTTHDGRHTAVTRMLQAGTDLSTIGSITGHSDATLILHYSHATRESKKTAANVLDIFVSGEKKKAS